MCCSSISSMQSNNFFVLLRVSQQSYRRPLPDILEHIEVTKIVILRSVYSPSFCWFSEATYHDMTWHATSSCAQFKWGQVWNSIVSGLIRPRGLISITINSFFSLFESKMIVICWIWDSTSRASVARDRDTQWSVRVPIPRDKPLGLRPLDLPPPSSVNIA
jgi:hypothetical protein